jgi:hypothetical protein
MDSEEFLPFSQYIKTSLMNKIFSQAPPIKAVPVVGNIQIMLEEFYVFDMQTPLGPFSPYGILRRLFLLLCTIHINTAVY